MDARTQREQHCQSPPSPRQQPQPQTQTQTQTQTPSPSQPQRSRAANGDIRPTDDVPKEGNERDGQESPPPAYTPPMRTRLQENLAAALLNNPNANLRHLGSRILAAPVPSAVLRGPSPDPDEDPLEEDLSPINLRISTRVNVSRDNNLVALPYTPSEQAGATADAIVRAFKSSSVMEGGIPMVDQDGRPRPVRIEVDAGITVEGSNNIVGTEAIIADVLRSRMAAQARQYQQHQGQRFGGDGPSGDSTPARRRSLEEVGGGAEAPAAKRARSSET